MLQVNVHIAGRQQEFTILDTAPKVPFVPKNVSFVLKPGWCHCPQTPVPISSLQVFVSVPFVLMQTSPSSTIFPESSFLPNARI